MNYSINENLERIRGLITNRRKFSKKSFERKTILGKRRVENIKRKASETALESGDLVRSFSGRVGLTKIAGVGKDFFGRILKFVGFLAAGWLLNNLPTLLGYGEEFLARAQKFKDIAGNMVNAVKTTFSGMKRLLTAAFTNLMSFDFKDSQGRLEEAWQEVVKGFNDAAAEVDESVKLVTTPLIDETGRGSYSGKEIPPFGSGAPSDPAESPPPTTQQAPPTQTETETETETGTVPTTPTPQSSSAGGWGPVLDIIGRAESRRDGYNAIAPGDYHPRLSEMTLREAYNSRGVRRNAAGALGRYQFTDPFFEKASYAGLGRDDIFSPANQDKMAIALARVQVGVTLESIKQDPIRAGNLLAQIWAGLPLLSGPNKGKSYYEGQNGNTSTISVQEYETALRKVGGAQKAKTQPLNSKVGLPPLPPTGTGNARMSMMQQYGAPRDGRKHAGQDYDISGNETFYSRIGGKIVKVVRSSGGGYGNYVDIYNKRLNVTERIAEGAEILPGIRVGENVSPGQPVVRGESNTGVIHYEIRPGKTKGTGDDYGFKGTIDPVGFLKSVTPVREGNKIIVVRKSQFQNMIPQSTDNGTSPIIEEDSMTAVVNRWVRELAFDKIQQ